MSSDLEMLAAPFYAAAVVLAVSGATKLRDPVPAAQALRTAGLRATTTSSRAIGVAEIGVAVSALVAPVRVTAIALALAYGALAAFAAFVMVRRPGTDCGCFGTSSAPVGPAHLTIDVAAALVALGIAIAPLRSTIDVLADQPFAAAPFVVLTGVLSWLVVVTMTDLTTVLRATSSSGGAG